MTTIGVLNIVFGAVFTLIGLLMVLGGGFMTTAGAAGGGEEGAMIAAGGGMLMLVGVAATAINLMLFASGIGVLKVASWGRNLCIAYGVLGLGVYGGLLAADGITFFNVVALGYSVVLLAMFFTPGWKAAFSGATDVGVTAPPAQDQETREAA